MDFFIDMDDTVCITDSVVIAVAKEFNEQYLKRNTIVNENKEYSSHYYFAEMLNWSIEDLTLFYHIKYPSYLRDLKPKPSVKTVFSHIKANGHRIILLSSRVEKDNSVYQLTLNWLTDQGILYDKLIIDCKQKGDYLTKKQGIFIDDSFENCETVCQNKEMRVFQMLSKYNKKCTDPRITIVKDWYEFESYIEKETFYYN